jgi:cytochrome c-type biogenesis protein
VAGFTVVSILATASVTGSAGWGSVLLVLYSLGLGIPFVALALGFQRAHRSMAWLRRHGRAVEATGGVLLVAVGLLFLTGEWQRFFLPLQRWSPEWPSTNPHDPPTTNQGDRTWMPFYFCCCPRPPAA